MRTTLIETHRNLRAQHGLAARSARRSGAPPVPPNTPLTLALTQAGPPHSSVRHVMERIRLGLQTLGYEPDIIRDEGQAAPSQAVIGWGPWGKGCKVRAGAQVWIDPVDAWRLSPAEIRRKNHVDLSLGLSTDSCWQQMNLGAKRMRPLPLSHDPRLHCWQWRGSRLPASVMDGAVWTPAHPASQRYGSTEEWQQAERFWFVHTSAMQGRKRVRDLVEAFCGEFGPDEAVGLLVKTQIHGWGRDIWSDLAEWLAPFGGCHAPVVYSTATIAEQSLSRLYGTAGAYVSTAGMEGWDLPCLEAMACGAMIVATDCSGHTDFLNEDNAILIPCDPDSAVGIERTLPDDIARQLHYAKPKPGAIRAAMRQAFELQAPPDDMREAMLRTMHWFTPELTAATILREMEMAGIKLAPPKPRLRADRPRIVVCIPVYNYRDHLSRCLHGLELALGVDLTVLVQDDGSTDGTDAMIARESWAIPVDYERWPDNRGLPHARARLTERARATGAEFICYLDGDVVPAPGDWLLTLASVHVDGISGPRMVYPDNSVWWAGADILYTKQMKHREEWGSVPSVCDHVPGACQFMRLDLFDRGLYHDTEYPQNTWEDANLCAQVRFLVGEHCWFRPEVTLVHNGWHYRPDHLGESPAQRFANFPRGQARYEQLWGDAWSRTRDRIDALTQQRHIRGR